MGRLLAAIYGVLLLILGVILQFAVPFLGLILNLAGATKVRGTDRTYRQEWAQQAIEAGESYHFWMQEWGPWLFIIIGFVLSVIALFWKRIEEFWRKRYGLFLKAEYEDWVNQPQFRSEPYVTKRTYVDKNDRRRRITHCDYFIGVFNDTANKTVENVQVKLVYLMTGMAASNFNCVLHTGDNAANVSINPKTTEYFKLGMSLEEMGEMAMNITEYETTVFETLLSQSKTWGLQIFTSARNDQTGAVRSQPMLRNNEEYVILEISGRDVPATFVQLKINAKSKTEVHLIKQTPSQKSASILSHKHFPSRKKHWSEAVREKMKKGLHLVTRKTS